MIAQELNGTEKTYTEGMVDAFERYLTWEQKEDQKGGITASLVNSEGNMYVGYTILVEGEHRHVLKNEIERSPTLLTLLGDQAAAEIDDALAKFRPGLEAAVRKGDTAFYAEPFKAKDVYFVLNASATYRNVYATRWEISAITRDEHDAMLNAYDDAMDK